MPTGSNIGHCHACGADIPCGDAIESTCRACREQLGHINVGVGALVCLRCDWNSRVCRDRIDAKLLPECERRLDIARTALKAICGIGNGMPYPKPVSRALTALAELGEVPDLPPQNARRPVTFTFDLNSLVSIEDLRAQGVDVFLFRSD
jgi:hypothetical protein